ncbi:Histone acetyltransferase kat6b [Halocaridina rubra]|uniref:histone acetyltransferase n=1 Tax=Halocaridina rubra TaxID=373956 RepID=A0AAN8X6H1_HALRR
MGPKNKDHGGGGGGGGGDGSPVSFDVWRQRILSAIAKIRSQKQRPNLERITQAMRQWPPDVVITNLQAQVDAGSVLYLEKRGVESYADPRNPPMRIGRVSTRTPTASSRAADLVGKVVRAVRDLMGEESSEGATLKDVLVKLEGQLGNCEDKGTLVRHAIKRAIHRGFLKQNDQNKLFLGTEAPKKKALGRPPLAELPQKLAAPLPSGSVPQQNNTMPICCECLGTEKCVDGGFMHCPSCGTSVHPKCLRLDPAASVRLQKQGWVCDDCKTCHTCHKFASEVLGSLIMCSTCDNGYHLSCLTPPTEQRPGSHWSCSNCQSNSNHSNTASPSGSMHSEMGVNNGSASSRKGRGRSRKGLPESTRKRLYSTSSSSSRSRSASQRQKRNEGDTQPKDPHSSSDESDADSKSSLEKKGQKMPRPPGVTDRDMEMFRKAQEQATLEMDKNRTTVQERDPFNMSRCPASIDFGQYDIQTWYSAPYPQEYARLTKLFLCEFCLKYMKSISMLGRHLQKCLWRTPPGTEIYRKDGLSVFEVDGNISKIYCQNLCLLAKLFLDHKTLYYDVEPFLFYVLTRNDDKGCHLVGYFSKEKLSALKYNVSCIMTMPQYQRQGYGRFLIDFSYLLSKREGQPGTPEKPLSDLGRVSYTSYWKSVVLEYLHLIRDSNSFSIQDIVKEKAMYPSDVAYTLSILSFLRRDPNGQVIVSIDWGVVEEHYQKQENNPRRLKLDAEALRWSPLLPGHNTSSHMDSDEMEDTERCKEKLSKSLLVNDRTSREDAYVFKDEEDNDFEPSFRSLKSERRKSLTLKENQIAVEGFKEKRNGHSHAERKLSVEECGHKDDYDTGKDHNNRKGILDSTVIRNGSKKGASSSSLYNYKNEDDVTQDISSESILPKNQMEVSSFSKHRRREDEVSRKDRKSEEDQCRDSAENSHLLKNKTSELVEVNDVDKENRRETENHVESSSRKDRMSKREIKVVKNEEMRRDDVNKREIENREDSSSQRNKKKANSEIVSEERMKDSSHMRFKRTDDSRKVTKSKRTEDEIKPKSPSKEDVKSRKEERKSQLLYMQSDKVHDERNHGRNRKRVDRDGIFEESRREISPSRRNSELDQVVCIDEVSKAYIDKNHTMSQRKGDRDIENSGKRREHSHVKAKRSDSNNLAKEKRREGHAKNRRLEIESASVEEYQRNILPSKDKRKGDDEPEDNHRASPLRRKRTDSERIHSDNPRERSRRRLDSEESREDSCSPKKRHLDYGERDNEKKESSASRKKRLDSSETEESRDRSKYQKYHESPETLQEKRRDSSRIRKKHEEKEDVKEVSHAKNKRALEENMEDRSRESSRGSRRVDVEYKEEGSKENLYSRSRRKHDDEEKDHHHHHHHREHSSRSKRRGEMHEQNDQHESSMRRKRIETEEDSGIREGSSSKTRRGEVDIDIDMHIPSKDSSRHRRKAEEQYSVVEHQPTFHRESSRCRKRQELIAEMKKETLEVKKISADLPSETEKCHRLRSKTQNSAAVGVSNSREARRRKHSEMDEEETRYDSPVKSQQKPKRVEIEDYLIPKYKRAKRYDGDRSERSSRREREAEKAKKLEEESKTRKSKRVEEQSEHLKVKKTKLSTTLRRSLRGVHAEEEEEEEEDGVDGGDLEMPHLEPMVDIGKRPESPEPDQTSAEKTCENETRDIKSVPPSDKTDTSSSSNNKKVQEEPAVVRKRGWPKGVPRGPKTTSRGRGRGTGRPGRPPGRPPKNDGGEKSSSTERSDVQEILSADQDSMPVNQEEEKVLSLHDCEDTNLIEEEVEEEDQKIEALEKACTIQNVVDRKTPEPEEGKNEEYKGSGMIDSHNEVQVSKDCNILSSVDSRDVEVSEKGVEENEDEMEVEKENHDPAKDTCIEKEASGDAQEELSEADKAVASIMNGSSEPLVNSTCMEPETFSSSPPPAEVPEAPECKSGDGRVDEAYQEEVTKAVESIWGGTEERESTMVEESRPSVVVDEPKIPSPRAPSISASLPSSPIPSSPVPVSSLPATPLAPTPLPASPLPTTPLSTTPLPPTPIPPSPLTTSPLVSSPPRHSDSPNILSSSPLQPENAVPPQSPDHMRSPVSSPPNSPIPSTPPPAPAPPSPTSPSPVPSPLPPESPLEPPCAPAPLSPTSPATSPSPVSPSSLGSPASIHSPASPMPSVPVEDEVSSPPRQMALEADESLCQLPTVVRCEQLSEVPSLSSVSSHPSQENHSRDSKHCGHIIEDVQTPQPEEEKLTGEHDESLEHKRNSLHNGDRVPAMMPTVPDTIKAAGCQEENLASQMEQTYESVDAPNVDNHPTGQEAARTHDLTLDVGDGPKVVNSSAGNTPPSSCGSTNTTSVITRQAPTPTPPHQQEVGSMGVFTPDSTTNSVHSMHGYSQGEFDVSQLGIESPTSISSNEMAHSVEAPQQASTPQSYNDCAQITNQQVQPPTPTHVQPTTPTHVQPTTPTHVQPSTPTHTQPTTPTPPHITRTTPTPTPILPQPLSQPLSQAPQTIISQAATGIQTIPAIGIPIVTVPHTQPHHPPTKQPSKQRHIQPKPPAQTQTQNSAVASRPPSNLGTQLSSQSLASMHASSQAHMMTQRMMASTPHPPSGLGQHHPMSHHHGAHTPHPPRTHVTHTHPQMQNFSHPNYMMSHQQMLGHQGYLTQPSVNSYAQAHTPAHSSSYMTSVIQSRMGGAQQVSSQNSSSSASSTSSSQRGGHGSSGSSNTCGPVAGNYHFLNSSPPGPSPTPTPIGGGQHHVGGVQGSASSCSIARLQQLTNGIMDIVPPPPPCGGATPPPHTVTPPPSHTVTPPPTATAAAQRNMTPPISNLQSQVPLSYKYKPHQAAAAAQMSSNMMGPAMLGYQVNGYRMAGQPGAMSALNTSYLTNPSFMNQQLPMQMMNMHPQAASQYQDPRSQPQNTMYPPYSYMSPLQLNGTMRR